MSPRRAVSGGLFLVALLAWAWLLTLWTHELGHVIGALLTGSTVRQVVLHPLAFSRTDVHPNHNPLIVVWAGPVGGCVFGAAVGFVWMLITKRMKYIALLSGGFCWLVNAVYIGVGAVSPVADAQVMIDLGSPRWALAVFGLAAGVPGYMAVRRGVISARREIVKERSLKPDIAIIAGLGMALAIGGLAFFPGP